MAITKAMLARCQNELKQAFCALDKDVQEAINAGGAHVECVDQNGRWYARPISGNHGLVWRLSPDTPTEPEWEEYSVITTPYGMLSVDIGTARAGSWLFNQSVSHKDFLGIIYRDSNGTETLRTSVDAAFGTPVRVRFSK